MGAPYEKASGQYTDTFDFEALTVAGSAPAQRVAEVVR